MTRLKKTIYDFDEGINNFIIYCANKELTKKIIKFYEGALQVFAK